MMNQKEYIAALVSAGNFLCAWLLGDKSLCDKLAGSGSYAGFSHAVQYALKENRWFTEESVRDALAAISSEMLNGDKLEAWLLAYSYCDSNAHLKPIGVIAAGNIPLVCFHDVICVLLSGYNLLLKPSSKDKVLIGWVLELLIYFEPKLKDRIKLVSAIQQSAISGLIATGSNNTARYIEYEYPAIPVLSRKSRTSAAIVTGNETEEELTRLAYDIFSYFGMGCRNVSKLYVPNGYDFSFLLEASSEWAKKLSRQPKYISSYRYEHALSISLGESLIDGKVFLLKKNKLFNSPLSVIYYDFFTNLESVKNHIAQNADLLQCVVATSSFIGNVRFGQTQQPALSDYADGIDTIQWLANNIK